VNTRSLRLQRSARVYTNVVVFILLLTITVAPAQTRLTIEPVMTKGPADAPVTIIEFSDYQ
jgi:protein-disulfide isomerase